jgi:hypothetical protein
MPSSPSQSQFTPPSLRDRAVSGNSASSRIIEQFTQMIIGTIYPRFKMFWAAQEATLKQVIFHHRLY